jgi:hypothetical protein
MMVTSKSRITTLLALFLIFSIVLGVFLIALGLFDPIEKDKPIWQKTLTPIRVTSQSIKVSWLKEALPQSPYSIRVTGNFDSGEMDSAFGLVLSQTNEHIVVLVSPLGYVSIWHAPSLANKNSRDYYLPWQTWPHISAGDSENEIYARVNGDKLSIRINREWLWDIDGIDQIDGFGIIGESFGEETTIDFHLAELSAIDTRK